VIATVPESAVAALDARLDKNAGQPLAVAFSGGGDSLAMLLVASGWARRAGRQIIAFTVDHRLQAGSGDWARWCAERAQAQGIAHRTLVWDGAKPATGLPAAARAARHRLIAEAARAAGARVVLFGHTLDDRLEAAWMAAHGIRVGAPRAWSPSPVWPEGRGQHVLRPLIDLRRSVLRDWLRTGGETWIDDPANADAGQPRIRARLELAGETAPHLREADETYPSTPLSVGPAGEVSIAPSMLSGDGANRLLGAAICCVSGRERPPRASAVDRLRQRISAAETARATLGGVRVAASGPAIMLAREVGDSRARGPASITLERDGAQVFDGRFEVETRVAGLSLTALGGRMPKLPRRLRGRLASLHPLARAALPALIDGSGAVSCPTLEPDPRVRIRALISLRLAGACGMVHGEAEIR
jgi:tRNA(Ile)-lysidine synthase